MFSTFSEQEKLLKAHNNELCQKEIDRIFAKYKEQLKTVLACPNTELGHDFLGFLDSYNSVKIPEDFTVIDFGCNLAVQALYFENCQKYIGVDLIPTDHRFPQSNAQYYQDSIQNFIKNTLPKLIEDGLDFNKTFAFCSCVPDAEAEQMVANTFKYNKVIYCDEIKSEKLPPILKFYECLELLKQLVEKDILKFDFDNPDNIIVYREAGSKYKEGWYSENIYNVAQELLNVGNSQQYLINILEKETGEPFTTTPMPSFDFLER